MGEREKEIVARIARRQARFKLRLMMIDPKCAITGETQSELLEAAHVVPVRGNGGDEAENGIMLRVDLHRLFDAHLFAIDRTGAIVPARGLASNGYLKLLSGKRLDDDTFARVSNALRKGPRG